MKLNEALAIGYDCGLETVGEAITNIEVHAMNLFVYSKIKDELNELYAELGDLNPNTPISDMEGYSSW